MGDEIANSKWAGKEPALICWYSGGFTHADGCKLLKDVQMMAAKHGVSDSLVLGFPNEYGITGEGYSWWPGYVDILIDKIDEKFFGRPLLLFGHSRGCCPCISVASRLGDRVLKVWVTSCGAIKVGEPTPWEGLSYEFKKGGDKELLAWFASLQPGNFLLARTSQLPPDEVQGAIKASKWLTDTVALMRVQYRDATFPDMTSPNSPIKRLKCPITGICPLLDMGSQPDVIAEWEGITTGHFEMIMVQAGHMDVLQAADKDKKGGMLEIICPDMATFMPNYMKPVDVWIPPPEKLLNTSWNKNDVLVDTLAWEKPIGQISFNRNFKGRWLL